MIEDIKLKYSEHFRKSLEQLNYINESKDVNKYKRYEMFSAKPIENLIIMDRSYVD